MPSTNSNVTPIRLASNESTWRELDQVIDDCVEQICGTYDEESVRGLMFLLDIASNPDIDRTDRECAVFRAHKMAFMHSPRFERAVEDYLNEINPGRVQKRTRKQATA